MKCFITPEWIARTAVHLITRVDPRLAAVAVRDGTELIEVRGREAGSAAVVYLDYSQFDWNEEMSPVDVEKLREDVEIATLGEMGLLDQ